MRLDLLRDLTENEISKVLKAQLMTIQNHSKSCNILKVFLIHSIMGLILTLSGFWILILKLSFMLTRNEDVFRKNN